jgi:hypothetical protein
MMQDPSEFTLDRTEAPPAPPSRPPRSALPWAVLAGAVVVIAATVLIFRREGPSAPNAAPEVVAAPATPVSEQALGAPADAVELPPLDDSDPVVRELVGMLSSHPRVMAWLATDGLIRNFTVVIDNIASGRMPARYLAVLRPTARFAVIERGEDELSIDPRSYDRYTPIADAAGGIDAAGAARLYSTLKPRIEEAYDALGVAESFDRPLERAIVSLLQVPVIEGSVRLEPKGAGYQYADPRLERLTPAQKQLLRMGPRNVRAIQVKLREVALALGVPPDRLPA